MQKPTDLAAIPSGMDNDPKADEQIINQQKGEQVPSEQSAIESSKLANSIALAIDGSGDCMPGSTPVAGTTQKVTTEGITGASLTEEEEALP